jgi:FkbM family methyltransferase
MDGAHENASINLHKELISSTNVVGLLRKYRVRTDVDYLSVDIDSSDLWVVRAILSAGYRPRLLQVEYNSHFPWGAALTFPDPATMPLASSDLAHWSGSCYYGASAFAYSKLAEEFDYVVVGLKAPVDLFLMPRALATAARVPTVDLSTAPTLELHFHPPMNPRESQELLDYTVWRGAGLQTDKDDAVAPPDAPSDSSIHRGQHVHQRGVAAHRRARHSAAQTLLGLHERPRNLTCASASTRERRSLCATFMAKLPAEFATRDTSCFEHLSHSSLHHPRSTKGSTGAKRLYKQSRSPDRPPPALTPATGWQPALVAARRAVDLSVPCPQAHNALDMHAVNANASLHRTTSQPPYILCLRHAQHIDETVRIRGRWTDCDLLPSLLPPMTHPRPVVVDVGANIGACTFLLAALGYRVAAFEPTPPTFAALVAGLAANSQAARPPAAEPFYAASGASSAALDVRLVNLGLSNASGAAHIHVQPFNSGNAITSGLSGRPQPQAHYKEVIDDSYEEYAIGLTTLDDAIHEPVSLLKLDCQGHELRALQGAARLLSGPDRIRAIKLEFYPPGLRAIGDDPMALLRLLDETGYDIVDVGGHKVGEYAGVPLVPTKFSEFVRGMENSFTDLVARRREGWGLHPDDNPEARISRGTRDLRIYLQSHWHPGMPFGGQCHDLRRLGGTSTGGDGAKLVCESAISRHSCFVISVGSNNEFSFERDLHQQYPWCEIHTLDGTVETPLNPPFVTFHKSTFNPARAAQQLSFLQPFLWSSTLMRQRPLTLLKIDCEGCEFDELQTFLRQVCVVQIAIEVHGCKRDASHATRLALQKKFQVFMSEMNVSDGIIAAEPNMLWSDGTCIEYTMLRRLRCPTSGRAPGGFLTPSSRRGM